MPHLPRKTSVATIRRWQEVYALTESLYVNYQLQYTNVLFTLE